MKKFFIYSDRENTHFIYGPSIACKDDHFAKKNALKLDEK